MQEQTKILPPIGATVRATCACHRNVTGTVTRRDVAGNRVDIQSPDFVGPMTLDASQFETVEGR